MQSRPNHISNQRGREDGDIDDTNQPKRKEEFKMNQTKKIGFFGLICFIFGFVFNSVEAEPTATKNNSSKDIRLYALNCGYLDIHDMAPFFNKGFYPHKPMRLADPCFLIKNPNGWMLWDLGVGDKYVGHPVDNKQLGVTVSAPLLLTAQLKQLGLTPKDIKFVGISHAHFDHTGNANLFPNATWLMQQDEYNFMQQEPRLPTIDDGALSVVKDAPKKLLKGDYDVFGDGTVIILSTPGHTPGHQSLEIKLPHQGLVILSGDLYHVRANYIFNQVPSFNTSPADTLASRKRVEDILHGDRSQLIIQHDPNDFVSLPKIPNYLN